MQGTLTCSTQSGVAGMLWCFVEAGKSIFDGTHCLKNGDILTVYADAGRDVVAWSGTVKFDYKTNREPYPASAGLPPDATKKGGQKVGAYWIDRNQGLQENLDPQQWLRFFLEEKPATLRTEIDDLDLG